MKKMITKSLEFDEKLKCDLQWVNINKNKEPKMKGSYKIKENGDILSDIDIEINVYFNQNLLKIIHNIIIKNKNNSSPFTFIHLIVGKYIEFKLPWILDNEGGIYYDQEKTKQWFFNIKELVPVKLSDCIEKKIFSSEISIKELIDIENSLFEYSNILWEQNDILKGYKYVRGILYNLLDEMKLEIPVMEYVYCYNNQYINVDVALYDRRYKVEPYGKMYKYYTNNSYKIMKIFRWKIDPLYKEEYFDTMKKVEVFVSLKYQINTIEKILLHHSKRQLKEKIKMEFILNNMYDNLNISDISLDKLSVKLDNDINCILQDSVEYYLNKLSDKNDILEIKNFLILGKKVNIL